MTIKYLDNRLATIDKMFSVITGVWFLITYCRSIVEIWLWWKKFRSYKFKIIISWWWSNETRKTYFQIKIWLDYLWFCNCFLLPCIFDKSWIIIEMNQMKKLQLRRLASKLYKSKFYFLFFSLFQILFINLFSQMSCIF